MRNVKNLAIGTCAAVAIAMILVIATIAWWPAAAHPGPPAAVISALPLPAMPPDAPTPPIDQAITVGICASGLTATGALIGISMAVPGAAPALAVLVIGCAIVLGGP